MLCHKKPPKQKKTVDDLLLEGQLKTGKTVLTEKAEQAKAQAIFDQAALEEARMQKSRTGR